MLMSGELWDMSMTGETDKGELNMQETKQATKVSFIHSIKTKIVLLVAGAVLLSTVLNMWGVIPLVKSELQTLISSYMTDSASILGNSLDQSILIAGKDSVLEQSSLEGKAGNVSIDGMESSYAYLVDAEGTMLYHPTAEKIGQPVENDAVKQLLQEMEEGKHPEPDVIEYEFNGVNKYAAYYIGEDMSYILIVTADENDALAAVSDVIWKSCVTGILTLILCCVFGFFVAMRICRPILETTKDVTRLADLDFTARDEDKKKTWKDENGVMMSAIGKLRQQLVEVIGDIHKQCDGLRSSSVVLKNSAKETGEVVEQLDRAMSDVAEGATSQASETQKATDNIISMGEMIEDTTEEVKKLRELAKSMSKAGTEALGKIEELGAVNQKTKEAVEVIADQTQATNASAAKIREVIEMITSIADQTNLLSLNASIEAARAGEAGKGFAVVASEIQQLATQSNESANKIAEIIALLIEESDKTVTKMEEVKEVMHIQDENVLHTQEAFRSVKKGIDQSMKGIDVINSKAFQLDEARVRVVDVVQSLSAIAEQNAASTQETSASATEVESIVATISDNAKQLNEVADQLYKDVLKFNM